MGLDAMGSSIERVTGANSLLGRLAVGHPRGGRGRLLVLDTYIAHRAGDGAFGLAEPWVMFSSLPLLPLDAGAEEADPWDVFK